MATEINPVAWTKTLSLDRGSSLRFQKAEGSRVPFGTLPSNLRYFQNRTDNATVAKFSDLKRTKSDVFDKRRAQLDERKSDQSSRKSDEYACNKKENIMEKKKAPRKASFKCKKPTNIFWKNSRMTSVEAHNTVAQLACKFNQMIDGVETIEEEKSDTTEALRHKQIANIPNHVPVRRVHRKPSVKTKPSSENRASTLPRRKQSINRRPSAKKMQCSDSDSASVSEIAERVCLRTGDLSFQQPLNVRKDFRRSLPLPAKTSSDSEFPFSVRAAIEIFEKRTVSSPTYDATKTLTNCVPKPKVPEKTFKYRTKELVAKDGVLKWKMTKPTEQLNENIDDTATSEADCDNRKISVSPQEEDKIPLDVNSSSLVEDLSVEVETKENTSPDVNSGLLIEESSMEQKDEKQTEDSESCVEKDKAEIEITIDQRSKELPDDEESIPVQIINIPLTPPKKCDSIYETQNIRRTRPWGTSNYLHDPQVQPNASFLWRKRSQEQLKKLQIYGESVSTPKSSSVPSSQIDLRITEETMDGYEIPQIQVNNVDDTYDFVDPNAHLSASEEKLQPPAVPPRPASLPAIPSRLSPSVSRTCKEKMPLPDDPEEERDHNYEYCKSSSKYEEIDNRSDDGYEYCKSPTEAKCTGIYETLPCHVESNDTDGYEYCRDKTEDKQESVYEVLPNSEKRDAPPPLLPKKQEQPLPPRPPSRNSFSATRHEESSSNCYESIYNGGGEKNTDADGTYEVIYGANAIKWDMSSNRGSIISCDQQSNSIYGRSLTGWEDGNYSGKANSEISGSDKSDEWIDISDNEGNASGNNSSGLVIVREKKPKKTGWPQKIRDQWNKAQSDKSDAESDEDHHYETLYDEDFRNQESPNPVHEDFDSFESDNESEESFTKLRHRDNSAHIPDAQLPDPPPQQYKFTKFAASAGKKMKKLKRNWTHHKNDITRSLTWMTRRLSGIDADATDDNKLKEEKTATTPSELPQRSFGSHNHELSKSLSNIAQEIKQRNPEIHVNSSPYQNFDYPNNDNSDYSECSDKSNKPNNTLKKSKFLDKFRKSMIISSDSANEITQQLGKPRSTFYLTTEIDLDENKVEQSKSNSNTSLNSDKKASSPKSPEQNKGFVTVRPKCPPPPVPVDSNQNIDRKSGSRLSSWYSECGIFKISDNQNNKHPSTSWYAEIGLFQPSGSTPSTSSAENSGNTTSVNIRSSESDSINQDNSEQYYNLKNERDREGDYYNQSIDSFSSTDTKTENNLDLSCEVNDIQLHLEDEPLYQFYDAAVLEDVCKDGTTDFDYDGYEEVGEERQSYENYSSTRPSAMQLIAPNKNGVTVARTLWCEIPEVLQSTVLSTLSSHQRKLQEAKFEMMTSEASYLNSLNVLNDHFINNFTDSEYLTAEEKEILFGKIPAVKKCSEKLLLDLEKCWQDNILLHGICEIVQKHAEENFYVYVSYCENQILLDCTLRQIKERPLCCELLKQLESSHACQSLTLYSFLMLPMQRITRWPLLLDAVLKRLSPQDSEYLPCQYALATINKIVTQCNEGARKMERITEMKKVESQLEFAKTVPTFKIAIESRWLVKSGPVTQMQARTDDNKLTFGKRFLKIPLHLFLFNDILVITKYKGEDSYMIVHHCFRSYVELNINEVIPTMPAKDVHGRNLLFLTLLENHEGKTVEMLLSFSSESDRERWIEALSPPKSEDPNETLYECWDCPQVTVIHNYVANQPDELTLSRGDILNVTRKMADGWYHGERIRDGQSGWFPSNYTVEVANPHVRARNLKQRYRLLALSESYLKSK